MTKNDSSIIKIRKLLVIYLSNRKKYAKTQYLHLALRSSSPCQDNGQQEFAICACL